MSAPDPASPSSFDSSAPAGSAAPRPLTDQDIVSLAAAPDLLVAMDFDGTLAHFSDDPYGVRAIDGAIDALTELAAAPHTTAMVISGRNMDQLTRATELPADGPVLLVGSHGAEPSPAAAGSGASALELTDEQSQLLHDLGERAESIASGLPGAWVEYKPVAVGLHTRTVKDSDAATAAAAELRSFAAGHASSHITEGKNILEIAVVSTTKGEFIQGYRERVNPNDLTVVFAGDDTTDETVLSTLDYSRDLGIRVGGGATSANRSLKAPEGVRDFLQALAKARRQR